MRGTMGPANLLVLGFQRISAREILARQSSDFRFPLMLERDGEEDGCWVVVDVGPLGLQANTLRGVQTRACPCCLSMFR